MNNDQRTGDLKGIDKAAALLLTLSAEESANVFRCIDEPYIERLTGRLLHREGFPPEVQGAVMQEANALLTGEQYMAVGGVAYARILLTKAIGPERAEAIIQKLMSKMQSRPFHYLEDVEPPQVAQFLHYEHPQVIALALSYLSPTKSAAILALLPEEQQPQVSFRLANMDTVDPAIVTQIETAFRKKLSSLLHSETQSKTGGVGYLVQVLTQVDRVTERSIIDQLDLTAPDLATAVKQQMFVFENLTVLDDRSMQRVLREVDYRDLALALRGATKAVRAHVFKNLSQRAAASISDELESSPPVRMKTIEEAQQRVVDVVRRLEDEEEIAVGRGANDVLV